MTDGRTDGRMDGQTDRRMNRRTEAIPISPSFLLKSVEIITSEIRNDFQTRKETNYNKNTWPRGKTTGVHSQTQNKAQ